jgi:hypothetical protein
MQCDVPYGAEPDKMHAIRRRSVAMRVTRNMKSIRAKLY